MTNTAGLHAKNSGLSARTFLLEGPDRLTAGAFPEAAHTTASCQCPKALIKGEVSTDRERWRHQAYPGLLDAPTAGQPRRGLPKGPPRRSSFLVRLLEAHVPPPASVLEVGCNVGRNLEALRQRGFRPLAGLEINRRAVRVLRRTYRELAADACITTGPAEDTIRLIPSLGFDVVFAFAVLEHLPPTSEAIFGEMVRVARRAIVTVEDEVSGSGQSARHFRRDYGTVFSSLGINQVESVQCSESEGLDQNFVARVFLKPM